MKKNIFFNVQYLERFGLADIPISVAFVAEDGSALYCISHEFNHNELTNEELYIPISLLNEKIRWKSRDDIAEEIHNWIHEQTSEFQDLAFWGINASQQWTILKNHYMMDCLNSFPLFYNDILQLADFKGYEFDDLYFLNLQIQAQEMNALKAARWIRDMYFKLIEVSNVSET